jgi:hypothetical protein
MQPLAAGPATTRRQVVDDGQGGKSSRFEFVRFREYG